MQEGSGIRNLRITDSEENHINHFKQVGTILSKRLICIVLVPINKHVYYGYQDNAIDDYDYQDIPFCLRGAEMAYSMPPPFIDQPYIPNTGVSVTRRERPIRRLTILYQLEVKYSGAVVYV